MNLNTVELFSGTQSFSKVMRKHNHKTFCVDNDSQFENDLTLNIEDLETFDLPQPINILWCSPPCTFFSVASIGRHWNKDNTPKTKEALKGLEIIEQTLCIINVELERNPDMIWFLENPRGKLRKLIDPYIDKYGLDCVRHTVTYCQYGDNRMKPTDIWTNCKGWKPKPICKNGSPCHVSAPRGSQTGTQGLKNSIEKGRIPPALFEEILNELNL